MSQIVLQTVRGRYAPSPTGNLHLGNLRTALLAWLFVRSAAGQFVLRVEDLDQPRVRPGATAQMLTDLRWLGLDWDEGPDCGGPYTPYTQSERNDIYTHQLRRLQEAELIYPCYCSRSEIASAASAQQQGSEDGPRYPGTCRDLTAAQRRRHVANGRRPALRFRVDTRRIVSFTDLIAGPMQQQVQDTTGDFIVCRSDGIFAYQFAVVVDDALMGINQIVRGVDLLNSTARQILLYEALGFSIPTFAHVPLVLDAEGKRLSKRTQSAGLTPLRNSGTTAQYIVGQLAASCGLLENAIALDAIALAKNSTQQMCDIMRPRLQARSAETID